MKKIALSAFVVVSFLLYSFGLRNSDSPLLVSPKTASAGQGGGTSGSSGGSSSAGSGTSGGMGMGSQMNGTMYKDGTYTGPAEDAYYGNVQVQATIQGGKITQVKFLQYPNDRPNSVAINQQAMPYLQQEAIQAQSAHINGVSGATDTSIAFAQSLSSALQQAM